MLSLSCIILGQSFGPPYIWLGRDPCPPAGKNGEWLLTKDQLRVKVNTLFKFVVLSRQEKWLYLNTAFWLLAVKVGLYLLPFERLRGWLAHFDPPDDKLVDLEEMRSIIQTIERIGQFLAPLRNCLLQALVGHRLLGRKGFNVQLKIGVLKHPGDQLAAHAWLEYQGRVILGDLRGLEQFAAFPALEVARR